MSLPVPLVVGKHPTIRPASKSAEDLVRFARQCLEESDSDPGWTETRRKARESFRFRNLDQWPEDMRSLREEADRPALVIDKMHQYVQNLMGEWRGARTTVRHYPVDNRGDPATAEVLDGLHRAIEYESGGADLDDTALEHAAIGGFGWLTLANEYPDDEAWDQVLRFGVKRDPFTIFLDPCSVEPDLSDCRYYVDTSWITEQEFTDRWPGKSAASLAVDETDTSWVNADLKLVRIAKVWWREPKERHLALILGPDKQEHTFDLTGMDEEFLGRLRVSGVLLKERRHLGYKIRHMLVSGADVLEAPQDWPGLRFLLFPVYGDVTLIDGAVYRTGLYERMKDPQRLINLWQSYVLEMLSLQPKAPWVGKAGSFGKHGSAQRLDWEESHLVQVGLLEYDGEIAPQRPRPPDIPAAMFAAGQDATRALQEVTGRYDEALGKETNAKSGRAIQARAHQGALATNRYPAALQVAKLHRAKVAASLYPIFYDRPRIVRILGEDMETIDRAAINGAWLYDEEGRQLKAHDLLGAKYDARVSSAPSYATRRQETFDRLIQLGQSLGPQIFAQMADIVVGYSDMPGAEDLTERLKQITGQAPPSPEQMAVMAPIVQQLVQRMLAQVVPSPDAIRGLIRQELSGSPGPGRPAGHSSPLPPGPAPMPMRRPPMQGAMP